MIRLDRIAAKHNIECELLAKCEFMSIGGSVKDRIALAIIEAAEEEGRLTPGKSTIVEATSGNTGVGLCLVSALKGYRCVIALPEKMSREKLNTMRCLGAEIIRTPTKAAWNAPNSHLTLAEQLQATIPDAHFLDQYINENNPKAHYFGTAQEILDQTNGQIDAVVIAAGTGGTITGIGARMRKSAPSCRVIGVDPHGSILAEPQTLNEATKGRSYQVEGIGYDFIPSTCNRKYVDEWIKVDDKATFAAARELTRLEGLLVGGSAGSAMAAALEVAKKMKKGQRLVVLLPDGARNYMSKHYSDEWMADHGFLEPNGYDYSAFGDKTVGDLPELKPCKMVKMISTINEILAKKEPVCCVMDDMGRLSGVVSQRAALRALLTGRFTKESPCEEIVSSHFKTVNKNTGLGEVARMLNLHEAVVILGDTGAPLSCVTMNDVATNL